MKKQITALVDCNSFYASCEKIFRPELEGRPVVVLSNNDGCIVAMSKEAKTIGAKRGEPYYKIKKHLEKNNTAVFSSNYALYADISKRVMNIISASAAEVEIYSIDEAFIRLDNLPGDPVKICRHLKINIEKQTGIPVSIGIGTTKTQAKLAALTAKKIPEGIFALPGTFSTAENSETEKTLKSEYLPVSADDTTKSFKRIQAPHENKKSVYTLNSGRIITEEYKKLLAETPVSKIWGISSGLSGRLAKINIKTALDLVNTKDAVIKKTISISGLRTVWELRGIPSIEFEDVPPDRKTIMSSRSFKTTVKELPELLKAVSAYCTTAAAKLRENRLICKTVEVSIRTNYFSSIDRQYKAKAAEELTEPTSYLPDIISAAHTALKKIYRPGFNYKKVSVRLINLESKNGRQISLFCSGTEKKESLMSAVEEISGRYGRDAIKCGLLKK